MQNNPNGDTAQLPPVGETDSPALQQEYISSRYPVSVWSRELKEVTRQSEGSGILFNATLLRKILLQNEVFTPNFSLNNFEAKVA